MSPNVPQWVGLGEQNVTERLGFEMKMYLKGRDKPRMFLQGSNFPKFSPAAPIFPKIYRKSILRVTMMLLNGSIFGKCSLTGGLCNWKCSLMDRFLERTMALKNPRTQHDFLSKEKSNTMGYYLAKGQVFFNPTMQSNNFCPLLLYLIVFNN